MRPLPFLVPIYGNSSRGVIKVRIGLTLYDWLTPGRNRERYRVLKAVDALSLEPGIQPEDLRGAGYYFDDLLLYPERLCLENVLSACRQGARAFNYAQVEEVRRDPAGKPNGVRVRDLLTGRVATLGARVIVNATGPWVDELRALAGVRDRGSRILRRTKGIHCVLPRLTDRAIYQSTRDDRMIFVIPWREFSLVGTTDTDFVRRRSRPPPRHPRRGRLPARRGAAGGARSARHRARGRLHLRRGTAALATRRASASRTSRGRTRSSRRRAGAFCRSPGPSSRASAAWPRSSATA